MMKFFLSLVAMLLFCCRVDAQAAGVKKLPGEPVTFTWSYLVADEPNITGFKLYSGPTATGPFTFSGTTVASPSLRTVVIPASFSTGSIMIFYTARAYFTTTQGTGESVDSNAVEVDRAVNSPTALLAK